METKTTTHRSITGLPESAISLQRQPSPGVSTLRLKRGVSPSDEQGERAMKTLARTLAFVAIGAWFLGTASLVEAQGRSGGAGKGTATQQKAGSQQGQPAGQGGDRATSQDRQMQRIQLPDQQRDRFNDCAAAANGIRRQAGDLAKATKSARFNAAEARQQRDQLHQNVGSMFQEHDRLMTNLGDNARATLQDRTRMLDQDRDRIHTHLQAMDRQLQSANPDRDSIRAGAREVKKAMKAWQRHYRQLGYDVGARAG